RLLSSSFFFSSRRRHTRFSRDWSSDVCSSDLADGAFEGDFEQLLGFDREFHGQLAEDLLAEAVDDHRDRVLLADAAAAAIEHLEIGRASGRERAELCGDTGAARKTRAERRRR